MSKDGACILKHLHVQNPLALLLVQSCQTLEQQIGDGTTSCALLTSELMYVQKKNMITFLLVVTPPPTRQQTQVYLLKPTSLPCNM